MVTVAELTTDRLRLRHWVPSDRAPFAALNADPEVMQHFPETLDREQSDALAARIQAEIAELGYGLWAVELVASREFIGFVGLEPVTFTAPFTPATEVGWRLGRKHWGQGYATEAAREALRFAFEQLRLDEVVSMTARSNLRSIAVMERLGMTRDPADDFEHPRVPEGHPLRRHVLYRIRRQAVRRIG